MDTHSDASALSERYFQSVHTLLHVSKSISCTGYHGNGLLWWFLSTVAGESICRVESFMLMFDDYILAVKASEIYSIFTFMLPVHLES